MVSQPALFNLAAGNFYRSTEQVAKTRAETRGRGGRQVPAGEGASEYEPRAVTPGVDLESSDPFTNW